MVYAAYQDDVEIRTQTTWTSAIVGVRQITTSSDGTNRVALFQQPGEFYFDKTQHTVYYYKSGSEDMTSAKVFAPNNVSTLLRIAARRGPTTRGTSRSPGSRSSTPTGA
ncbi:hypothetical protein [Streptomyces sp. AC495_CC817]|uniref:hypothetical protein n=1 Tax=Streptomyces sp. AC495_CC817 TaxID=2823900 RepID=UPI0020B6B7BE|nr:hypothetical protein [Streptomyces sp. AC495_CC817]